MWSEDLGFVPSFADWVKAIRPEPWIGRALKLEGGDTKHKAWDGDAEVSTWRAKNAPRDVLKAKHDPLLTGHKHDSALEKHGSAIEAEILSEHEGTGEYVARLFR
jgi:hypothetical protein